MTLTLQQIEDIAPDQASLSSAKKLLGDNKWQGQGFCATTHIAWGECQGSGSKPYYVVADITNAGYKCTCPSRKFPCKHALALMWRYVNDTSPFVASPTPDWVSDWLGRRRKTTKIDTQATQKSDVRPKKSISLADDEVISLEEIDPKKLENAKKRAEKVKVNTDAQISLGLVEFVGWLDDQIRLGMGVFMDNAKERSRQISARLVDAKASGLASMVDELPSVLLNTPKSDRAKVAFAAFGRWYLLCQAWHKNPDDKDVRRTIAKAEDKQSVKEAAMVEPFLAVTGVWQVVGETIYTRRDGLISHATYLVKMADGTLNNQSDLKPHQSSHQADGEEQKIPNTAMLLDFHHPTSGFKRSSSKVGSMMVGQLMYYPSRVPFRAFFESVETKPSVVSTLYYDPNVKHMNLSSLPSSTHLLSQDNLRTAYAKQLNKLPWVNELLYVLGAGHIAKDERGVFWYVADEAVRLANTNLPPLVQASDVQYAFILWNGLSGELLSVQTQWGLLTC